VVLLAKSARQSCLCGDRINTLAKYRTVNHRRLLAHVINNGTMATRTPQRRCTTRVQTIASANRRSCEVMSAQTTTTRSALNRLLHARFTAKAHVPGHRYSGVPKNNQLIIPNYCKLHGRKRVNRFGHSTCLHSSLSRDLPVHKHCYLVKTNTDVCRREQLSGSG
jgi:hypothetical protein